MYNRDLETDMYELRSKGNVPVEVYGHNFENIHAYVPENELKKVYTEAGNSSVIELEAEDGNKVPVIVQDLQYSHLKDAFVHVDFYKVNMDEKVKAEVEIKFVGESPAVKNLSGVLVTPLSKVEISCLPGDLLQEIEVDLSALEDFDSAIHVRDLKLGEQIEIMNDEALTIAFVEAAKEEEIIETVAEETTEETKEEETTEETKENA